MVLDSIDIRTPDSVWGIKAMFKKMVAREFSALLPKLASTGDKLCSLQALVAKQPQVSCAVGWGGVNGCGCGCVGGR